MAPKIKSFKELVLGRISKGGHTSKPRQKICILNIYWHQKNTGTLAWAIQKIGFGGSIWKGASARWYPQTLPKYLPLNIYWYENTLAP